jgi:hypothetical protein
MGTTPDRYTVEWDGKFTTGKSTQGAVGLAIAECHLKRPISWREVPDPQPWKSHTIINGTSPGYGRVTINVYKHKL